ncbi:MAG: hypothetical protein AMXMBFR47_21380 [Planctomycetota bacterium]
MNFSFFPLMIVAIELGRLSRLPGPDHEWLFYFNFAPIALMLASHFAGKLVRDRQQLRLDDADGLLCLHCGRAMENREEFAHCGRCDDHVRTEFVRKEWGWEGASSGRRERVAVSLARTARTAANWPAWVAAWVILAIALLPLLSVWQEQAVFVIIIPVVLAAAAYGVGYQARQTLAKRARRECLKCGYSLVGHEEWSCPECGQQVDWSDEAPKSTEPPPRAIKGEGAALLWVILALISASVFSYSAASTYVLARQTEFSATLLGTPAQIMVPGALDRITDPELGRHARALVLQMLADVERGPAWIMSSAVMTVVAFVFHYRIGSRVRAERERDARIAGPLPGEVGSAPAAESACNPDATAGALE